MHDVGATVPSEELDASKMTKPPQSGRVSASEILNSDGILKVVEFSTVVSTFEKVSRRLENDDQVRKGRTEPLNTSG